MHSLQPPLFDSGKWRTVQTEEAEDEAGEDLLDLKSFDISLEIGFGSDLFFQLFKFSPELRYSRGLRNMLNGKNNNQYNLPLDKIIVHNISFFFTFEGGPK